MEIKHRLIGSKGMFYYEQEGKPLADMTYSMAGDALIIIDHTEVNASLRGQNVGKQLLHFAVDYVRKEGIKIILLCPFAKSVFDKTPAYGDVLSA
jgi:predicted GNAT family acetyltransferase